MGIDPKGESPDMLSEAVIEYIKPLAENPQTVTAVSTGLSALTQITLQSLNILKAQITSQSLNSIETQIGLKSLVKSIGNQVVSKGGTAASAKGFAITEVANTMFVVGVISIIVINEYRFANKNYERSNKTFRGFMKEMENNPSLAYSIGKTVGNSLDRIIDISMKLTFGKDVGKRLHDSKFGGWFRSIIK